MKRLNASFAFFLGVVTMILVTKSQDYLELVVPGFEGWLKSSPLVDVQFVPAYLLAFTLLIAVFFALKKAGATAYPTAMYLFGVVGFILIGGILCLLHNVIPNFVSPIGVNIPPLGEEEFNAWLSKQSQFYTPAFIHIASMVALMYLLAHWATNRPDYQQA